MLISGTVYHGWNLLYIAYQYIKFEVAIMTHYEYMKGNQNVEIKEVRDRANKTSYLTSIQTMYISHLFRVISYLSKVTDFSWGRLKSATTPPAFDAFSIEDTVRISQRSLASEN